MSPAPDRYETLDGLRGFAAIAVALLHYDDRLMPGGHLAVDFFFVLSGFVLVRTYEPRFRAGLSPKRFMIARLIRLYPLFAVGLLIGAAYLIQHQLRTQPGSLPDVILGLGFNTLMLPAPLRGLLFPINAPAWSLFMEVLANLAMALALIRMRTRWLTVVSVLSAGLLLTAAWHTADSSVAAGASPLSGGSDWSKWYIGLLRTAVSFTIGMIIARLPEAQTRARSTWALACWAILLALMAAHISLEGRLAYDAAFILLCSPMLVVVGRRIEPIVFLAPLGAWIGEVSYAVYAVHMPIAHAFAALTDRVGVGRFAAAPAYVLTVLLIAWMAVRWIDLPVRRWLSVKLVRVQPP
ncbi:MAG: acyltransferase, partial [Novosphingobium sp.]